MNKMSKHLSARQLRAIDKLGDAMLPGSDDLPRFSSTGCVSQVDRVLDYMPEQDRKDLGMLLTLFSLLPRPLIRLKLGMLEWLQNWPLPFVGGLVRLVRLGVRGLIMTLYYSHPEVHRRMGYEVGVYLGE